ncbi:MAG: glycosyltransferase [Chitinophagaceae bacterium]|nr:glycosyltransferase [Chitinophagaceae bacterium]
MQQPNNRLLDSPPTILPVTGSGPRPLWSVMIPAYNCSKYIKQTLESVLAQDRGIENMQIEVIDDHSTDVNLGELVKEIGKGRVTYYCQETNVGNHRNFVTCLNRSRGHIIHMLHGDDTVRPGFYESMERFFNAYPEAVAAFCRHTYMDSESRVFFTADLEKKEMGILDNWLSRLLERQRIQTPSIVVKRSVYEQLGGFYGVLSAEDWEMWLRIAARYPTGYIPEILADYRMHTSIITGRAILNGENMRDVKKVMQMCKAYIPGEIYEPAIKKSRKFYSLYAIRMANRIWHETQNKSGIRAQIKEALSLWKGIPVYLNIAKIYVKMLIGRT